MILNEGGNVFKLSDESPLTRRILKGEVPPTIAWLEKITGLDFTKEKDDLGVPKKWLGTTGRKIDSGDLDLSVDDKAITKEQLTDILAKWCRKSKIPEEQIFNKARTKASPAFNQGWIQMTGDSVHFKTPIAGSTGNGFVQTDFMFGEPDWQAFAMKGGREGSPYVGMSRHIILASIISAMHPGFTWSYKNGIIDKKDPKKPVTIPNGKNPQTISKMTGIPLNKLNSADDILDAIKGRPDFTQITATARDTLAHSNIQLPESYVPGTSLWFRQLSNKLV